VLIVVPHDVKRFVDSVSEVLDELNRHELSSLMVIRGVVKRWLRGFSPPSERECLRMALDYLTWKDQLAARSRH
jgi:hypothetical protein